MRALAKIQMLGGEKMPNYVDEAFSEDNLLSYSGACLSLAIDVPEKVVRKSLDTLVIPSRGAVPFFLGMTYALDKLRGPMGAEYADFYDNLGVQPMLTPLLPENSRVANSVNGRKYKVLMIPFTADLNLEKFDENEDAAEYTSKTRNYWANVTAAFFKGRNERKRDPYFRTFADVVLKQIEGRDVAAEVYESFPPIKRFCTIDTVISGRASNEILRSFDILAQEHGNEHMMPHAFLVVDKNGDKLRKNLGFYEYLRMKENIGQVNMFPIANILSEDKGASLLGVSAVVYPSVMRASKKLEYNGQEFFVGAGSWFLGSELGEVKEEHGETFSRFKRFMDVVYRGIDAKFVDNFGGDYERAKQVFNEAREGFLEEAHATRIFCLNAPNVPELNLNFADAVRGSYDTHSQVVHVPFNDSATRQITDTICNIPGVHSQKRKSRRSFS